LGTTQRGADAPVAPVLVDPDAGVTVVAPAVLVLVVLAPGVLAAGFSGNATSPTSSTVVALGFADEGLR
jgi:hypothetical protein